MNPSEPATFRRTITGAAMIAAPLVFVLAELLHARFQTDPAKQLDAIAANTGRWYAAHMLVLAALVLALPAFVGVLHLLEAHRPRLASVGLVAIAPGAFTLTALVGMELVAWQMAQPARDRTEMIALWENTAENTGIAPLILGALLFPIAWLLVGVGLYVTRAVPRWSAALIALAQPIGFLGELSGGPKWLAVAAQISFAVGLIPIGIRVLRKPATRKAPGVRSEAARA
ncbi:MAG: hypothetical protein ACRDOF_10785 [Gaiellaceae bacterium]